MKIPFDGSPLAICFHYKDRPVDGFSLDMARNHLSYVHQNFANYRGTEIIYAKETEEAVEKALAGNFKYLLLIREGTIFNDFEQMIEGIQELWTENHFCIGHILDRKERYYELHEQMFLMDLQKFREMARFPYRCKEKDKSFNLPNVTRSDEDYHDDYTPLWTKKGEGESQFFNLSPGAQWIAEALRCGFTFSPFTEKIRHSKEYILYREKIDYYDNFVYLKNRLNSYLPHRDFDLSIPNVDCNLLADHDYFKVIYPAMDFSFLSIIKYLAESNKSVAHVLIYDNDFYTLEFFEEILKTKQFDEPKWNQLFKETPQIESFINNDFQTFINNDSIQEYLKYLFAENKIHFLDATPFATGFPIRSYPDPIKELPIIFSFSNYLTSLNESLKAPYNTKVKIINNLIKEFSRYTDTLFTLRSSESISTESAQNPRLLPASELNLPYLSVPWEMR